MIHTEEKGFVVEGSGVHSLRKTPAQMAQALQSAQEPRYSGLLAPGQCGYCRRHGVEICCKDECYLDGSTDDATCVDCCRAHEDEDPAQVELRAMLVRFANYDRELASLYDRHGDELHTCPLFDVVRVLQGRLVHQLSESARVLLESHPFHIVGDSLLEVVDSGLGFPSLVAHPCAIHS